MELSLKSNKVKIDYEGLLSHHDLVFNAPVCDIMHGIPIGNGDVGALFTLEKDALVISINKTDLWDESSDKESIVIPKGEENMTTCCSGAVVKLKFNCPIFDGIYAKSYKSRLSLADATVSIDAETPFCSASVKSFASSVCDTVAVRAVVASEEALPFYLDMERWGSRTLAYWYLRFESDCYDKRLYGTKALVKDGAMYITESLNGTFFAVGLIPKSDAESKISTIGSRKVRAEYGSSLEARLEFYITIAVSDSAEGALCKAKLNLDKAMKYGFDGLYTTHKAEWLDFWSKSFVTLPCELDFIENLWYLNLYYANSSMRGKYPAHFCNGIWNNYHDFVPWNHYFHYNMQHAIHPLGAANHSELCETYLNFRANQLPLAIRYAKEYKGKKGAFYCDVCDKFGRNEDNTSSNCTPGSQIAMMLYRHALYTGNKDFLYNKALPVMVETANYYLDTFKKEEDGYYHISDTQGYEGSPLFKDSITDHAMLRSLFSALEGLLSDKEYAPYKEVLDNIAPFMKTKMYDSEVENGIFSLGIGKGRASEGEDVLSVGIHDGRLYRRTFGDPKNDWYGFPDTEMSPVFPAGIVGIRDKGSKLYNMIYNSLCLHHTVDTSECDEICMGWCMLTVYLARMGLSDLLETALTDTASTWITYPNGMGIYGPYNDSTCGIDQFRRLTKNTPRNVKTGEICSAYQWDFRHLDYETLPIIATAVNEMLVQSYDGTVRLFGAVDIIKEYAFSLMATNGFEISAVYRSGECNVIIKSNEGGSLRLCLDNLSVTPRFFDKSGNEIHPVLSDDTFIFATEKDDEIFVTTGNDIAIERNYERNNDVKILKKAQLGCKREY